MGFTVIEKHYNTILHNYWFQFDTNNNNIRHWITKQPKNLWYSLTWLGTYTLREELYTLFQHTWGDDNE